MLSSANYRRFVICMVIVAITSGAAVGWTAGQLYVQAKLEDVEDFGEAIIVSLFHEAGIYDFIPVICALIGALIAITFIAIPPIMIKLTKVRRRLRAASNKSRNELAHSIQNAKR